MDIPLTIEQTQEGLKKGQFSALELVNSYLARIKKFDSQLNSFITVVDSYARKRAEEINSLIKNNNDASFKKFPLLGVCVTHKDMYLTKGIKTTAASKVLENFIPQYSATVVERLESAGCILLGKANCDAWAHGASGENSDFGPTKNPWNKQYVPGGSSSGSAAAIAANFSLIATGTDTGGSIRQPASFCGIFGLKPTYGAVSRYGVVAMASSTDCVGNFGRCTNDIEKVYDVIKGEDGKDSCVKTVKIQDSKIKSNEFIIGIPKEYFVKGIDPEVENCVKNATKVFEKSGVKLVEVSLPHTKYAISVYYIVQPAEVSSNLGRYDGIRYGKVRETFGDEAKRRIMLGTYALSAGYYEAYYLKAMKVRSILIKEFDDVFKKVNAIITPVSPTAGFKLGEKADDPLKMYLADIFTVSANLVGIPGLSIPYGFTKEGLPLGFQLMGPRFSESVLFKLAKTFEMETNYKPQIAPL